jgi:hypothetical protein
MFWVYQNDKVGRFRSAARTGCHQLTCKKSRQRYHMKQKAAMRQSTAAHGFGCFDSFSDYSGQPL